MRSFHNDLSVSFDFDEMLTKAFPRMGGALVNQARANMAEISYGHTYVVNGRIRIASKRGDTANNQTHDLTKSLKYERHGRTLEFGGGNDRVNYAGDLELRKNRPNFVKSFRQKEDVIESIFNREIRRELER